MEVKNTMTSAEIVDIIKACSKCGVRSFSLHTLRIQFDEPTEIVSSPKKSRQRRSVESELSQSNNSEQLELEEINQIHEEFIRGQLTLTDPLEFEKLQIEGEEYESGQA